MAEEHFWRKSYGRPIEDLDPEVFETDTLTLLSRSVTRYSGRAALIFMGVEVSFGQLDEYANVFANMLLSQGLKKGDVVGLNLPNTPQYVIAWLGAMKAGCVSTGVSPLLTADEMAQQLDDSGAKVLVTLDSTFAERVIDIAPGLPRLSLIVAANVGEFLPGIKRALGRLTGRLPKGELTPISGKTVLAFAKVLRPGAYPATDPGVALTPDDSAYVMYTGGTTGLPKGAVLTHRNSVAQMQIAVRYTDWDKRRGAVLSAFPMFHIAGLMFNAFSVYCGWTQVLLPDPRNTGFICQMLRKHRPFLLANVPSLYYLLLSNPEFRKMDHASLEQCICAAAPFPVEAQQQLEAVIGEGKLIELYGMTETTAITVMNPIAGEKRLGSAGLPMINTDIKIVDPESGRERTVGQPGELWVRCPHVMKEYLNNPEETANAIDEDGYMHTGDVLVQGEDGYLSIVDRTKDMIIVSGFKVFSKKVEDKLATHAAVDIAATVGIPNPERPGSELVKAFVQLSPEYDFDTADREALAAEILLFARQNLAPYEVPREIELRRELPLTSIGKLDKKQLRKEVQQG